MSVAKVETVQKSQKDQGKCEHCGVALPKGSAYRYFYVGFRATYKHVRCMKPECTPKLSERESSTKADVYRAQEDFEANLAAATTADDVQAAYESFHEAVDQYATEREEALEAWENGNSQLEEVAEAARQAADDMEGAYTADQWDGPTEEELHDFEASKNDSTFCAQCGEEEDANAHQGEDAVNSDNLTFEEWLEDQKAEATERADDALANL
jgi:hypothetical protein